MVTIRGLLEALLETGNVGIDPKSWEVSGNIPLVYDRDLGQGFIFWDVSRCQSVTEKKRSRTKTNGRKMQPSLIMDYGDLTSTVIILHSIGKAIMCICAICFG